MTNSSAIQSVKALELGEEEEDQEQDQEQLEP
ncbi:MAG: hypothetical protein ACJAZV_001325 [Roseivirga sp.]|jgi:hypothetical protein